MNETLSIINETKDKLPSLPFSLYKDKILGKKYELDLIFTDEKKMKALNKTFRKKGSPTDILSFPLSKTSGQIFICQKLAMKESKKFKRDYENFISFLFVHGAVHLLGFDHGTKMEKVEIKFRKVFKI